MGKKKVMYDTTETKEEIKVDLGNDLVAVFDKKEKSKARKSFKFNDLKEEKELNKLQEYLNLLIGNEILDVKGDDDWKGLREINNSFKESINSLLGVKKVRKNIKKGK